MSFLFCFMVISVTEFITGRSKCDASKVPNCPLMVSSPSLPERIISKPRICAVRAHINALALTEHPSISSSQIRSPSSAPRARPSRIHRAAEGGPKWIRVMCVSGNSPLILRAVSMAFLSGGFSCITFHSRRSLPVL